MLSGIIPEDSLGEVAASEIPKGAGDWPGVGDRTAFRQMPSLSSWDS
jgi:hypothetical protein